QCAPSRPDDGKLRAPRALWLCLSWVTFMAASAPRSIPTVLAALAGFAITAAAVRLEQALRRHPRLPGHAPLGTVRVSDEPFALQQKRALEKGRGRRADAPT